MAAINPGDVVKEHKNALLPIFGIVILILALGFYLGSGSDFLGGERILFSDSDEKEVYDEYPSMTIRQDKDYRAEIVTNKGTISVNLFEEDAPLAVNNFKFLSDRGFYRNLTFHRVIDGFMIQGGDPEGDGTGGPGYSFDDELNNGHPYAPGVLAMANSGANTNGSQFFITVSTFDPDTLTTDHTVFGEVTEGMDIVDEISKVETDGSDKPLQDVVIEKIIVDVYMKD